jgi:hypothetical protein
MRGLAMRDARIWRRTLGNLADVPSWLRAERIHRETRDPRMKVTLPRVAWMEMEPGEQRIRRTEEAKP